MNSKQKLPIIVAIPFWERDRNQALDLCKLIAHMEPEPAKNEATFLVVNRQDCVPDMKMVDLLATKFTAMTFRSRSPKRGWPSGPNGMFATTMLQLASTVATQFDCIFWMEPDCVPMRPTWWRELLEVWRNREPGKLIVGYNDGKHINGNALYDPNIARRLPFLALSDRMAWDWEHRKAMVDYGESTNLIYNAYRATKALPDAINSPHAVIHGYKDDSLMRLVASKYQCY